MQYRVLELGKRHFLNKFFMLCNMYVADQREFMKYQRTKNNSQLSFLFG